MYNNIRLKFCQKSMRAHTYISVSFTENCMSCGEQLERAPWKYKAIPGFNPPGIVPV